MYSTTWSTLLSYFLEHIAFRSCPYNRHTKKSWRSKDLHLCILQFSFLLSRPRLGGEGGLGWVWQSYLKPSIDEPLCGVKSEVTLNLHMADALHHTFSVLPVIHYVKSRQAINRIHCYESCSAELLLPSDGGPHVHQTGISFGAWESRVSLPACATRGRPV